MIFILIYICFMLLGKHIDPTTIIPIRQYIDSLYMKSNFPIRKNVIELLQGIDD